MSVLSDVSDEIIKDVEHFFVSYNTANRVDPRLINRGGPEEARRLIEQGMQPKPK